MRPEAAMSAGEATTPTGDAAAGVTRTAFVLVAYGPGFRWQRSAGTSPGSSKHVIIITPQDDPGSADAAGTDGDTDASSESTGDDMSADKASAGLKDASHTHRQDRLSCTLLLPINDRHTHGPANGAKAAIPCRRVGLCRSAPRRCTRPADLGARSRLPIQACPEPR